MANCPPRYLLCGQFLCSQQTVGFYLNDATCGVPTCGYATCGMWWAYLCTSGLQLTGVPPDGVLVSDIDVETIPAAQLQLGAVQPLVHVDDVVSVLDGQLQLGALVPTLHISTSLFLAAAELDLGAELADFIGQQWLSPNECVDLTLEPLECR